MERPIFHRTLNATSIGSLRQFSNKWKYLKESRRQNVAADVRNHLKKIKEKYNYFLTHVVMDP